MPSSITKGVSSAGAIVGNGALERHRDLTDGLSGGVLFLASHNVGVIWVAHTGAEVKNQREALMCLSLGSRRSDPKQCEAYCNK